jgi:hypothetical protein
VLTDHRKLDAKLAAVLSDESERGQPAFEVFVHLDAKCGAEEIAKLAALGVRGVTRGRSVLTARLSRDAIAELSDQPWVSQLRLSQKLRLRPADNDDDDS